MRKSRKTGALVSLQDTRDYMGWDQQINKHTHRGEVELHRDLIAS